MLHLDWHIHLFFFPQCCLLRSYRELRLGRINGEKRRVQRQGPRSSNKTLTHDFPTLCEFWCDFCWANHPRFHRHQESEQNSSPCDFFIYILPSYQLHHLFIQAWKLRKPSNYKWENQRLTVGSIPPALAGLGPKGKWRIAKSGNPFPLQGN